MATRFEKLFAKKDEWVSLNDLCNENNRFKANLENFLRTFSTDNGLILVSLFPCGILSGLVDKEVQDSVLIFAPTFSIEDIPQYLNEDGYIAYPVATDRSISEDYPKEKKRQDFVDRIHIVHKKNNVPFSNISHMDIGALNGFRILCTINSNGQYRINVDFIENWSRFDQDDLITVTSDLVPRIYFEEI